MKKIFFNVILICISFNVFCQEIKHNFGFVISDISFPKRDYQKYRLRSTQFHASYKPSVVIKEFSKASLIVSVPVSIGFSVLTNKNMERSAGAPIGITTHLPVVCDYNFVEGNSENNGAYFGVGFDYFTFLFPEDRGSNSYGPLLRGGYHFDIATIGLFYKKSLETKDMFTIGLSIVRRNK